MSFLKMPALERNDSTASPVAVVGCREAAFNQIQQFEVWARKNLPEELVKGTYIGPVDLGEFKVSEGERVKVVWGLSEFQERFIYIPEQPRLITRGRQVVLSVVQNPGERQITRPLVYERDLVELSPRLVGGLLFHLDGIRGGRIIPSGRLNYWT